MAKDKVKVKVLSVEVGKVGSKTDLPDNAETAQLVSEGKVEVVK